MSTIINNNVIALAAFWTMLKAADSGLVLYHEKATVDPALDGRILTHNVAFEWSVRSKIKCGVTCARHAGCAAFTFMPDGTCRGYSVFPTVHNIWISSPGARTWIFHSIAKGCLRPDYHQVAPSTCLRLFMSGASHDGAKSQCQSDQATLFIMKNKDRADLNQAFIRSQGIPDVENYEFWLDATEIVEGGNWIWGDGEILSRTDPMWYSGEPNDAGSADCVIVMKYVPMFIDDKSCWLSTPFVCEITIT